MYGIIPQVPFEVEYTNEFGAWWSELSIPEQTSIAASVELLQTKGPALGRPHVDTLRHMAVSNLKELRVQHAGEPLRILFAFDPRRIALLLLGGSKAGDERWYDVHVAKAEKQYAKHLLELKSE